MKEQQSLDSLDSLVFQFAVKTREVSQKKNEIQQNIKACRTSITEKKSYIEAVQGYLKNLEEEIRVKQDTVTKNKEKAKSMKATNSLLLQYEQTLKADLETRNHSYNRDQEVYEERIASYRQTLQSHKETYFQNPAAQKLLLLQAEAEEIDRQIKDCDDCIKIKQKELERLDDPDATSYSIEELTDRGLREQPRTEEEQPEQTSEDCSIGISSIDLNQAAVSNTEPAVEANTEETNGQNKAQEPVGSLTAIDKTNEELWSNQQLDEPGLPDEIQSEADAPSILKGEQVQLPTFLGPEEVPNDDQQVDAPDAEDHQGIYDFPQTSQADLQSKETSLSSAATFPFSFSPSSSPHRGTSEVKSSTFMLNLNPNVSTPGFSGFGFDVGSSQEEDSSFAFSGSFFNEKKTTEAKSSSCSEFLFDQPEQSEDFQFDFSSKSPQSAKKNSKDEFPFLFNF